MTQEKEEKQNEPKLSFVELNDDNTTMLFNGEPKYTILLTKNIARKKSADKKNIIETLILNACDKYGVDYVAPDNIRNK